nr:MAG TPA: hypothetical protein [Caudoviricetes sp.]
MGNLSSNIEYGNHERSRYGNIRNVQRLDKVT